MSLNVPEHGLPELLPAENRDVTTILSLFQYIEYDFNTANQLYILYAQFVHSKQANVTIYS